MVEIPTIEHPETTIFFVGAHHETLGVYTIIASSPITGVETILLEDNRLVIDIENSTTALSGAQYVPPFMAVRGIRVSQFEETVSRVVFDLESGAEFSIEISPDRTTLFLRIHQQNITNISVTTGNNSDSIVITGVRADSIRPQPATGRLIFHMANTQSQITFDENVNGIFASHAEVTQFSPHMALLSVSINPDTVHTITPTAENQVTIFFHPATFRNIKYDFDTRTFRIPRTDGFVMNQEHVSRFDMYHQRRFILQLPVDVSRHLGFGEILVADALLHSMTISHSQGATQFTFTGNQIFTLDIQRDDNYYFIRMMHPSERYSRIVVIDPGHGGHQPGAVRSGVRESDMVLAITNKLLQLIENDGFIRAYTTRNSDVYVSLRDRAEMGNDVADMFVSIHINAARNTSAHGIETYYRANMHDEFRTLTSRMLADIMHRNKLTNLGSNDREVRTANFAVLRYSTTPAVLLELGFMSNPAEFARMQSTEFQWNAARAIYNGMLEAFTFVPQR